MSRSRTKRPRVAIDLSAGLHEGAGIARLVRELVGALLALEDGPELAPYATRGPIHRDTPAWLRDGVRRELSFADRGWRAAALASQLGGISLRSWLPEADVVHGTNAILPHCGSTPTVLTVHDLIFFSHPEVLTPLNRSNLRMMVPRAAARARLVTADSQATADELVRWCRVDPRKIRVVHAGYDAERFRPGPVDADRDVLERLGLEPGYLLYVGMLQPRKNVVRLTDAFARLRREGLVERLVLAGAEGWAYGPMLERLAAADVAGAVTRLGAVDDGDLPALYRGAGAFGFPSLVEGFGLPPLEAMACGVPVVTSNTSSLPEVVGSAALTVPPEDVDAITAALRQALGDAQVRERLKREGPARAAAFTWTAAARRMAEVYREAVGGS